MARKKKNVYLDGIYFGEQQENAVVKYLECSRKLNDSVLSPEETETVLNEKNRVYNEYLKIPIRIMSESILLRYFPKNKYDWGFFTMIELIDMVETHLIFNMGTFNEDKIGKNGIKVKAYSYFQTIVKNHYIKIFKDINKSRKQMKNDILIDNISEEVEASYYSNNIEDVNHTENLDRFIKIVIEEITGLMETNSNLTSDEIKAGHAIIHLFKNWETLFLENTDIGVYQKKVTNKYTKEKTLFLISEYTGMTTKEFRKNMRVYSTFYRFLKEDFVSREN